MNAKRYIYSFLLVSSLLALSACDSFLDVNVDPNNPTEVSPDLLLSSAQGYLAYTIGGDMNRYAGLFVQHYAGVQGQHQEEYDIYNFNDDETDNLWRFGMYAGGLMDIELMIQQATDLNAPHYAGVGKIMKAHGLGVMTDCFGRIPFDEAFQLNDNIKPVYDNQQDIYNDIQAMLDEAIGDLGGDSELSPGSDDLVFGGDLTQWVRFANFLKLRYYNHTSKQDPNGSATAILNLLDGNAPIFESQANDAEFVFFASPNSDNPIAQFEAQRGQIAVSKSVIDDRMLPLNDPRLPQYAVVNADGEYKGAPNGEAIQDQGHVIYSAIGPFWASQASPVSFGSYFEMKFIEAEAALRANDGARAHGAYLAAIKANFDKLGLTQDDYDTYVAQAEVDPGEGNVTLKLIMEQKFLAMFTQGAESWTDWRRTDFPEINPSANNLTGDVIPVRFPYPNSEISFNSENVPDAGLLDPVWFQDGTED